MKINYILLGINLILSVIVGLTNPALASKYNDAVIDSNGNFVRNRSGDCIRTIFTTISDPCALSKKVKAEVIKKIMMMDERIVYFDFDKYELKSEAKDKLQVLADVLIQHNITAIKIVGYTDKIGTDEYNQALSEKRAKAAKEYINSLVKLDSSIVELRGLGKNNLVKDCPDIKKRGKLINCLAPNRRVEIEIDYYD